MSYRQEKTGETEPDRFTDVLTCTNGKYILEDFNIKWFEKQTGMKVTGYQTPFIMRISFYVCSCRWFNIR